MTNVSISQELEGGRVQFQGQIQNFEREGAESLGTEKFWSFVYIHEECGHFELISRLINDLMVLNRSSIPQIKNNCLQS